MDVGGSSGSDDDDGSDSTQNGDDRIDEPFDARALKSMKRSDVAHAGMSIRTNSGKGRQFRRKKLCVY